VCVCVGLLPTSIHTHSHTFTLAHLSVLLHSLTHSRVDVCQDGRLDVVVVLSKQFPRSCILQTQLWMFTHTHTQKGWDTHIHDHCNKLTWCSLYDPQRYREYTARHCTPPHCTTLHHTALYYTTLHYTTLHHTALHHTTLHHTTPHYTTPHYTTLHYTSHLTHDQRLVFFVHLDLHQLCLGLQLLTVL
jgi:hypothetical protein